MEINWGNLINSIPGAIVGIIVAWIGWKGRKEESSVTFNGTLLQSQDNRIKKLEDRLDSVESRLRDTEAMLRVEEDRTHLLRRGLTDAIGWLREFIDWARCGAEGAAPQPDLARLTGIVGDSQALPTARNPPTDT